MPSLLNFNPLLQTYNPNAGADDIREGAREAAAYAARGIERAGERGREREKEFTSVFDVDISKVSDMETKQYAINKYGKLKNEYIKRFQSNRDWLGYGNLPPEQRIELNGDLDSLKSEIETFKVYDNNLVKANETYNNPSKPNIVFEVDDQSVEEYSNAKKTGTTEDLAEFLKRSSDSPTGQPFVKYRKMNPDQVVSSYAQAVKEVLPERKKTIKKQWESQGKVLSEAEMTTMYGDEKMAKDEMYNLITTSDSGMGGGLEYNLQSALNDEEKAAAVRLYGGEAGIQYPLTKLYIDNKADISSAIAPRVDVVKEEKPVSTTRSRTGDSVTTIERTDVGWDMGTTPIKITKDLTYNEDGSDRSVSLKGANVIGVREDNGSYSVRVMVPMDAKSEAARFGAKKRAENATKAEAEKKRIDADDDLSRREKRRAKKEAEKMKGLSPEDNARIQEISSSKEKEKVVDVPLDEKLHKELQVAFERYPKGGLNLPGFDDITFEDKPADEDWGQYLRK